MSHEDELRNELAAVRAQLAERDRRIEQILHMRETERRVLADELHEQAAQALAAVALGLAAVERDLAAHATRAQIGALRDRVAETLRTLRDLAVDLRPPVLDQLGLQPALAALAARARARTGHRVTLVTPGLPLRLPVDIETTIYRLIEDLVDVLGPSSDLKLTLVLRDGEVELIAMPLAPSGATALSSELIERVKARLDLAAGLVSLEDQQEQALVARIPARGVYQGAPPSEAGSSSSSESR